MRPRSPAILRRRHPDAADRALSRHDVREATTLADHVDVGGERGPGRGAEAEDGERGGHHVVHDHCAPVDGGRGGGGDRRGVGVAHGEEE
jgi:hypothetical protein